MKPESVVERQICLVSKQRFEPLGSNVHMNLFMNGAFAKENQCRVLLPSSAEVVAM